ncbi:Maleylacetoacetate isomerase [Purpureocillium lavendulum]|uniref:Maleylacetoacetate isomerase n=1 Tax=Purpureocillium lavendulum TaxID=1247861 RepID=A0AB34FEA6_9HYPO|nr:Maleylacetoacetate isomerase [Purpureocillium lavendulum]
MESTDSFHLYTYYASSCCQRVIIAAHLKGIKLSFSFPNLGDAEHRNKYKSTVNPSATVPTLVVAHGSGGKTTIRQSVAILEYLEERYPNRYPLLPPVGEPEGRALVRDFVNIISSDTQPPANSRIAQRVKAIRNNLEDQIAFVKSAVVDGLEAYEQLLGESLDTRTGATTIGAGVTMADVCLIPAVDQALIYRFDLQFVPNIMKIYKNLKQLEAFKAADWRNQEDTPAKYRIQSS